MGDAADAVALTIAALVERARRLADSRARLLLGVTGPPGAGKSTLAAELARQLGRECAVVAMDGFHLAQAELIRLHRADCKGAPDTFDVDGYVAILRRLRENRDPVIYGPLFRREIEEPIAGAVPVPAEVRIVITEGNYLLLDQPGWSEVRPLLDEVWFLDVADDERRDRLTKRRVALGYSEADARRWAAGSDERNAETVAATRSRADLIVRVVAS